MESRYLAWLAGIIDGEGYVGICKGSTSFRGEVCIANTNFELIAEVKNILNTLGVTYHVGIQNITHLKKKQIEKVIISKHLGLEKVLSATLPYLIGKRLQGELVLEWVREKIEKGRIERGKEWAMYEKGRNLNRRGR